MLIKSIELREREWEGENKRYHTGTREKEKGGRKNEVGVSNWEAKLTRKSERATQTQLWLTSVDLGRQLHVCRREPGQTCYLQTVSPTPECSRLGKHEPRSTSLPLSGGMFKGWLTNTRELRVGSMSQRVGCSRRWSRHRAGLVLCRRKFPHT